MEYKLISEVINSRQTYGIEVCKNGKASCLISDLSENKDSVAELVSLLNELKVEENALKYIIEDYLTYFKR